MVASLLAVFLALPGAQSPQFRSSVTIAAIDVQILEKNGMPVPGLLPEAFEVTIGGRRRPVVSADRVQFDSASVDRARPTTGSNVWPHSDRGGRDLVLVVDTVSFDADVWQRTMETVRVFLRSLHPADRVGLYAYPPAVHEAPTTDHEQVGRALAAIGARGRPLWTRYNLRPSEIVDVHAAAALVKHLGSDAFRRGSSDARADNATVQAIHLRECPSDPDCPGRIMTDALNAMSEMEGRAVRAVDGLAAMLSVIGTWPGRQTVVFLTGGLTVSDQPGARPGRDDLERRLGPLIAQTHSAVYTLFVDETARNPSSAVRRVSARGADPARDLRLQSFWLEQFSAASGGTLLTAGQDYGEAALREVLRETSAYYVLGVEAAAEDRDGRPRSLRVRLPGRSLTIRHRSWVTLGGA
jgi:VWFA-related protein